MQQTAASSPSAPPPSFAGLLAQLTAPEKKSAPAWSDDDLEDDFATLSYERALKTHARYKPIDPVDSIFTGSNDLESAIKAAVANARTNPFPLAERAAELEAVLRPKADTKSEAPHSQPTALECNLKQASITIRMSKAECEQLHRRASEAGLTVSAYLRSCTFEAEALRAQVKETLAQLRAGSSTERMPAAPAIKRNWFGWLKRLMPRWVPSPRQARA